MNPEKINKLEREIFEKYGDRKSIGRIDLIGCISNGHVIFHCVPKDIEHSEFIPQIKEQTKYKNIIPLQLRFKDNYANLEELIFGVSSYETENKIIHNKKDIKKVISATLKLMKRSEFYNLAKIRVLNHKNRNSNY